MNRILIVGQWFISEDNGKIIIPGGTERYVYGLAKQLQIDGYDINILSASLDKNKTDGVMDGLSVHTFKVPKKNYGYSIDFISFINTLVFIKKINPDLVHVISSRYKFATGAIAAAKIMKKRIVYTRTTLPHKEHRKWLSIRFEHFFHVRLIKKSDVVIALSKEIKDVLGEEIHPKLITIIPSFVMKNYYREAEKDSNRLLFVGRLDKLKGIEFLLESVSIVKKEIPGIRLSIAGSGSLLNHLKEMVSAYNIEENIKFEGHLGDEDLVNVYSKSEIFLFPSLWEGMPMALIEAMSAGLPIIAFDIEPCIEALDSGKYGILVKKKDVKSLAEKIIQLLRNDELRNYYSRMSLERSKEYTQKIIVRRIEEVYSSLM